MLVNLASAVGISHDTKTRLLEVAAVRVHQQGFFQTSLDEIAADAKIAKATIYHHFKNKEELGKALIDFNIEKYLRFLQKSVFVPQFSGLKRLQTLSTFIISEFSNGTLDQGCPICNLVSELSNYSDTFRQQLERFFNSYRELVAAALQDSLTSGEISKEQLQALDVKDVAALFLSQLQGSILLARTAVRQGNRQAGVEVIQQSLQAFYALLGVRP
jgi:TetR/AcrR family transcriptional regulator, transcriptional repressor for nem operon